MQDGTPVIENESGSWYACDLCTLFNKMTLTQRYCQFCGRHFCDGVHGTFLPNGPGICVVCKIAKLEKSEKKKAS